MPNADPRVPRRRPAPPVAPAVARRAFTLVELMVSVAMVLVIILGVNAIFRMASDTVNAGQALAAANRDNRAVQSVIYDDFRLMVGTGGPMLLIRSERVAAFRNRADEQGDRDYNPAADPVSQDVAMRTIDLSGNNTEGEAGERGERIPPLVYNNRNHRIDRVSFFGSNLYRRQTGTESVSGTSFVDEGTSFEAYHWYGHLDQPDFGRPAAGFGRFQHRSPGELPKDRNPNNFYATDWILGRSITLLKENPVVPGMAIPPNYINDDYNNVSAPLSPLSPRDNAKERDQRSVQDFFASSRYDLAQTSISAFRQRLAFDIFNRGQNINGTGASASVWYEVLGGDWTAPATPTGPTSPGLSNARFQGYPYPDRPLTAYGLARTVPVWVRGCTQFMVEYAGDYLEQNPVDGAITGTYLEGAGGTDGQVDFLYVPEQGHPSEAPRSVRRIRWYGMPRNVDTYDDVAGTVITGAPAGSARNNNMYDVIPLRDLLLASGVAASAIPADFFEHFEGLDPRANYAADGVISNDPRLVRYYAAWGPGDLVKGSLTKPKMLRITMTVDDPNGRLTEGQTFEYVVDVP